MPVVPFSLKEAPALIETLFPAQKLSIEAYKEQMAGSGKTLTALGSYWKGRKPLILNRACVLGCLLPVTANPIRDLEIFEKLMAMDETALTHRLKAKNDKKSRSLISSYQHKVDAACRPEECDNTLYDGIWPEVNAHLGTEATSFPELVEQLGIMRFGHRPRFADVFSGSGQIPFEAARLGCDVYASDLNPVACMLTWGSFHLVGAQPEERQEIAVAQARLVQKVQSEVDALGIENDGKGWRAKAFLYCVEVRCPQTGWMVPLIPSLIVSQPRTGEVRNNVVVQLVPLPAEKRYRIDVVSFATEAQLAQAELGTVQGGEMVHSPDGTKVYRTKISTLRGDYAEGGETKNRLRMWEKHDFVARPHDLYQERLYCVQWLRTKAAGRGQEYEFRSVTPDDLTREKTVIDFVGSRLAEWQAKGWVPDMVIEAGAKTDEPIRTRGWTHWHHLFNPRQLLVAGLVRQNINSTTAFGLSQVINWNSRLCRWNMGSGGGGSIQDVFYNQALNTLFNYGCRNTALALTQVDLGARSFPFAKGVKAEVKTHAANAITAPTDLFITDPPYGDAVKYEEILEFFIAWLRKNPPAEFKGWVWDSRRVMAIKGEDDKFRQAMIDAYSAITRCMPDNGMQVIMFTHQSGSIWADMAHIVWAAGLQVTAA
ncbi:MAG: DUF1156 domain-containing protein [Spirochaetales bacterium]